MQETSYRDGTKVEELFHIPENESRNATLKRKAREALDRGEINSLTQRIVGRNETCPCGSGKKFKKCCIGKEWKRESNDAIAELKEQSDD